MIEKEALHQFETLFSQNYERLCQRVYRMVKDKDVAEYLLLFFGLNHPCA